MFTIFATLIFDPILAERKQISCEEIKKWDSFDNGHACIMNGSAKIDITGVRILPGSNEPMALYFRKNKKIFYLPIRLQESFSKLIRIEADRCTIKSISYENFKGLRKLALLDLRYNRIERIVKNTFEDLVLLKWLWLRKNINLKFPSFFQFFSTRWKSNQNFKRTFISKP